MEYKKTYDNIFGDVANYNVHVEDKSRYDFIINEIIANDYETMIDISSGRGYLLKYVNEIKPQIELTSTDLKKYNDFDVDFIELDLTKTNEYERVNGVYEFLSCLDVLEHIEEKYINNVLKFLSTKATNFCFSIANHSDIIKGVELHLIQKNMMWWNENLNQYFTISNAFTMYNDTLFCYTLKTKG